MLFPSVVYEVAKNYNDAYILCEVNDVGDQVASILQYDLEYQNLLMCSMRGRAGQIVGPRIFGQKNATWRQNEQNCQESWIFKFQNDD